VRTIFLVYCIASLFYYVFVLSPALCDILPTVMVRYSLFVLKVPLNSKQTNLIAAVPKSFCRKHSGYGWFDKSRVCVCVHVYVCVYLCSVHFFDVRN